MKTLQWSRLVGTTKRYNNVNNVNNNNNTLQMYYNYYNSFSSISSLSSIPKRSNSSSSSSSSTISKNNKNNKTIIVDNPYTGDIHCEVKQSSLSEAKQLLRLCNESQKEYWKKTQRSVQDRQQLVVNYLKNLKNLQSEFVNEITNSMGKPLQQSKNEFNTMIQRAEAVLDMSTYELTDESQVPMANMKRIIRKEPVGTVFVIAPWNYPLLCSINSIIPALLAGNSILFKMSSRTPRIAELFAKAMIGLNVPRNLITPVHCDHEITTALIQDPQTGFVVFTGSVPGGQQVQAATATRFINTTLELGGKDPAYVREDCNVEKAAYSIVDGAVYNAGQSCCAVERCYVHESVYDKFLECCVEAFKTTLKLGDPKHEKTTVGPMASPSAPQFLQKQVEQAVSKGAKVLYGTGKACTDESKKGRFFSPTLLSECDHSMDVMKEESFGPILPICKVKSDSEALKLMNDSQYGLTASIYTNDEDEAMRLARVLETGTVYMNRCDYLDPYLAWTGVKDTGKGVSLSKHCFEHFTKLKSLNFKLKW